MNQYSKWINTRNESDQNQNIDEKRSRYRLSMLPLSLFKPENFSFSLRHISLRKKFQISMNISVKVLLHILFPKNRQINLSVNRSWNNISKEHLNGLLWNKILISRMQYSSNIYLQTCENYARVRYTSNFFLVLKNSFYGRIREQRFLTSFHEKPTQPFPRNTVGTLLLW